MPTLDDENFGHSVTLICHHDEEGAMGVVINQPLELSVAELFSDAGLATNKLLHPEHPVWFGGPVRQENLFILHDSHQQWQQTIQVSKDLYLATSFDFLEALADGMEMENYLLALGCAGWAPGQLEYEMAENSWVYAAAQKDIIFNTSSELRWQAAASLAGIDLSKMSYYSGQA
ncbi:MAG: YqgE/AlgH family protein [Gammaproteobacteria bacterium]|nr:YqgE/AlgH family protein [Gammaproteobacteria bacterium]